MKNATEVVTDLYRKFPKVEFIDERDLGEDIVGLMFEYRNTEVDEEQLKAYLDSIGNWYRIRESREFYGGKSLLVKAEDDYVSLPVEDDLGVDWYYKHRDDYDPYGEPKPDYLLGEAVEGERAFMLRKGVLPDGTDSMLFIVTPSNRLCIVNGKEGMNDPTNTEPLYMQGEKATIGGWEEELDKDTIVSLYLHQDGIVLDDADEEIDTEEDPEEGRFKKIASKSVLDSDGFYTDYTWYFDKEEGKHVFVFGDTDVYYPEDEYYDWEVEGDDEQAQAEAQEWFDSYNGFDEEDRYDEGLKESLIDDIHTDFNIARKNWKKLGFSIPFDDALTIWQNKSELAEPKWITKPIYDPDAWEDMVRMFRESQGGSKNESLKESSSELPEKANLKKILDRFNSNGKSAKQGSWAIAKGGYDLDFQVSYKGEPIIDCVDGELHINKKEYEGGSTKEVAKIISSTYKDTSLKEEIDLKNTVNTSAPRFSWRDKYEKFKKDALQYDYCVVKSSRWYDPEGLDIPSNAEIVFAGTKQECFGKLDQIVSEQCKVGHGQPVVEDRGDDYITIYYPSAVSKATFKVVSSNQINESLKEDFYPNHADFIVDVYAHDDNLDPTEKLGQIPVSVEELYKRFTKEYVDKLLSTTPAEAFDTDRWQGYGNATNLELLIEKVAERKLHWQSPEYKEIVGDRGSFIISLPTLLNKDLLPSRSQLMSRTLGKKLLPPIGQKGRRNESFKEDYCDMFGCESGFFTRDDLNELMYEINDRCPKGMQATAIYMSNDGRTLEVDMEDEDWGGETVYKKIDMRKIRKPSDLLRYANSIIADFQNTVGKWEVGNEE